MSDSIPLPPADPAPRRRLGVDVAVATAIFLGVTCTLATFAGDLFPLIEYRQWIAHPPGTFGALLGRMFFPGDANSRQFAYYFVGATWQAVGGDIELANIAQLGLLGGTAAALFLLLRCLHPALTGLVPSVLCTLGFAFSLPVVDAISWQATVLDKLAVACFSLALLSVAPLMAGPVSPAKLVYGNLVPLVPMVLAYNSKEAAWGVLPVAWLLLVVEQHRRGGGSVRACIRRATLCLALPGSYAAYHLLIRARFWLGANEELAGHVFGGEIGRNLRSFLLAFFNLASSSTDRWVWGILGGLAVLALLSARRAVRNRDPGMLTPSAGLIVALAIPAATKYGCLFYLLVPLFLFWWLVHASVSALDQGTRRFGGWTAAALATALLGFAQLNLLSARSGLPVYARIFAASDNFRAALPEIARMHPLDEESSLVLAVPQETFFAYRFTGESQTRDLARFMFPDSRDRKALVAYDARIQDQKYASGTPPAAAPGTSVARFDDSLSLIDLQPAAK